MSYVFSGPFAKTPPKGATVTGRIYVPSCMPWQRPLFDYEFSGQFIGECADGFMVKPNWRSDGGALDTIFCRELQGAA